ncbi:MAG: hypothetical protein II561_06885 [Thermoguttaceae bacterium]|nr:hypothetical protein [Thermoguttaceae bacterium]
MTELSSILPLCAYAVLGTAKSNAPGFWTALVPAVALAFGIWQFRVQRDKSKRPDVYFRNESERERKFLQRQATRRMQIGALIGLFGVFALVGLYHPLEFYPLVWGLALFAAILALGWAGALAFADVVAIRAHYGAELDLRRAERLALEYKIKKFKENSLKELDKAVQEDGNAAPENEPSKENSPN